MRSPHRSLPRRVLVILLTVSLVTAFTLVPLAPSTGHADGLGCITIADQSEYGIVHGCALGGDFHNAVEQPVINAVLQTYDLPDSDAGRLLSWQRNLLRAAVFAKLIKIIQTPASQRTSEEQTAVERLAGLVQAQRLLAAQDALQEYNRWNSAPCVYNPPGPFSGTYDTSACGTLAGIFGLQPPTLDDFENYGGYLANSDFQTNSGLSLASQQAANGLALLGGAAGGAGAGAIVSILPSAFVAGTIDFIFPYALVSEGEAVAASGAILALPIAILILAATADIISIVNLVNYIELPDKLNAAITAAQQPVDIASLIKTKAGMQEVYGAYIRTTMKGYGSFDGLSPTDFQPDQPAPDFNLADRKFETVPAAGGSTTQTGQLTYLDWSGNQQTAWLDGGWFVVQDSNNNLSLSLSINVQIDSDGKPFKYMVERNGDTFTYASQSGDTSAGLGIGLSPGSFQYKDWSGHENFAWLAPPDGTPPFITLHAVTSDGQGDTVPYIFGTTATEPVTITFTCDDADGASDVATCPAPLTFTGPIKTWFHVQASDWSGNVEDYSDQVIVLPVGYNLPTVSATAGTFDGASYLAGTWINQPVVVSFACDDPVAGVQSCSNKQIFSDQGEFSTTGQVVSNSGFDNSTTFGPIKIDKTPPSISVGATTSDGQPYISDVWTNQPVTLHYTCGDDLSGIAVCPADKTISDDGVMQLVSGMAQDNAGNIAYADVHDVMVDRTPPTVLCQSASFVYGQTGATVSAAVSDATPPFGSGPSSTTVSAPVSTSAVGPSTVTLTGHDNAGNSTTVSCPYTVNKAATSAGLSSSSIPVAAGLSVTFTAPITVQSPGAGTPTGTFTFYDGTTSLGTGTLSGNGGADQATFTTSHLSPGAHTITAHYGGDANFNSAVSAAVTQYVDTNLSKYPTTSGGAYNLSKANLAGAYLADADLHGANLTGANLSAATLTLANLSGANLSNGNFKGANFSGANLSGANLTTANLKGATGLSTATLTGVIWSSTVCPDGSNSNKDGGTCVGHG